jgi:cytochrome c-type biogenesis protein CcmH/NrfF
MATMDDEYIALSGELEDEKSQKTTIAWILGVLLVVFVITTIIGFTRRRKA